MREKGIKYLQKELRWPFKFIYKRLMFAELSAIRMRIMILFQVQQLLAHMHN